MPQTGVHRKVHQSACATGGKKSVIYHFKHDTMPRQYSALPLNNFFLAHKWMKEGQGNETGWKYASYLLPNKGEMKGIRLES